MLRWAFGKRRAPAQLDPQSAYSLWADQYPPHPHNALMAIEHDAVMELLPPVEGMTVLDAGCGSGRYLRELATRGARPIGIDLSPAMLDRARQVSDRVARGDLRALPLDAMSIDIVVCGLALGDVEELELSLTEIARVLRPGGVVVYSVVHPSGDTLGWSRTFDAGGRTWSVSGHWHSLARHRQACAGAGLSIDAWREPAMDGSSQPVALVVRACTGAKSAEPR